MEHERQLRKLRDTSNLLEISYTLSRGDVLRIVGYTDLDYVGSPTDMKSMSDFAFKMASDAALWKRVKQSIIAFSTIQVVIIAYGGLF